MKDFKLIEHNLIPVSLFALNMSVVHLIYLLFMGQTSLATITIIACITGLISGIVLKNKMIMALCAIAYIVTLFLSL